MSFTSKSQRIDLCPKDMGHKTLPSRLIDEAKERRKNFGHFHGVDF